jgi:hypothetical protein
VTIAEATWFSSADFFARDAALASGARSSSCGDGPASGCGFDAKICVCCKEVFAEIVGAEELKAGAEAVCAGWGEANGLTGDAAWLQGDAGGAEGNPAGFVDSPAVNGLWDVVVDNFCTDSTSFAGAAKLKGDPAIDGTWGVVVSGAEGFAGWAKLKAGMAGAGKPENVELFVLCGANGFEADDAAEVDSLAVAGAGEIGCPKLNGGKGVDDRPIRGFAVVVGPAGTAAADCGW